MKIAITGHTSGVGQSLFNYFIEQGHYCIGFSRSTGHDISNVNNRFQILESSRNCDIFINNAYKNFDDSQFLLLKEKYNDWMGQEKIILNISSRITDFAKPASNILQKYWETKKDQDIFCQGKISCPQVINLKFGYIDTPRVKLIEDVKKLKTNDVIKIIDFIISTRDEFKITTLTAGL